MSLQKQIEQQSLLVRTDSYVMSIGEIMNLYKNKEIDLHPRFQRFFRWTDSQKTRLIESIMLGIPIPAIFVAQRDDGVWDVIDGLQRLSSILQFAGLLRDADDNLMEPLTLGPAPYLPGLEGKRWECDDPEHSLTAAQRLYIKRSGISVNIILKGSDQDAKYELFQRLNTGGTNLSDQEVRNCMLLMLNSKMFDWMEQLRSINSFQQCLPLTDRALEEQFDMELVLRFLVFRRIEVDELQRIGDMGEFLTKRMVDLAKQTEYDWLHEESAFKWTFGVLANTLREDTFRRYDPVRQRFTGPFIISAFEAVALGLGYHYEKLRSYGETPFHSFHLLGRLASLWSNMEYLSSQGSGVRASSRIPKVIPIGREVFAHEPTND